MLQVYTTVWHCGDQCGCTRPSLCKVRERMTKMFLMSNSCLFFKSIKKNFFSLKCFLTRQIYDTKKTDKHISWNTSVRGLSNLLDLCSFLKFIPRVKGVLQNSDSFLPSFNCDNSSPYNVKNKCKLWWTVMIWPFILQHTVPMYLKSNNRCIWDWISVVTAF